MLQGWGSVGVAYFIAGLVTTLTRPQVWLMPEASLDRAIAFDPSAIWIYLSFFLIIPFAYFHAEEKRVYRLLRSMQLSACVACCVFVFLPTSLSHPAYLGEGISIDALRLLSMLDVPTNCLPSLHAALTVSSVLALCSRQQPFRSILVLLWGIGITVSIVELRRHRAIDVGAGLALGVGSYILFAKLFASSSLDSLEMKYMSTSPLPLAGTLPRYSLANWWRMRS